MVSIEGKRERSSSSQPRFWLAAGKLAGGGRNPNWAGWRQNWAPKLGNQGQEREGNRPVVPIESKRGRAALSSQPPARQEALRQIRDGPPPPASCCSSQARPPPASSLLRRRASSSGQLLLSLGLKRRFASRFDRVGVKAPPHRFKML